MSVIKNEVLCLNAFYSQIICWRYGRRFFVSPNGATNSDVENEMAMMSKGEEWGRARVFTPPAD